MSLRFRLKKTPSKHEAIYSVVKRLDQALSKEYQQEVTTLHDLSARPLQVETMHKALIHLTEARIVIQQLLANSAALDCASVLGRLHELSQSLSETLQAQPWPKYKVACRALSRTANLLLIARTKLLLLADPKQAGLNKRVIVPSDLLYQAHHTLFPAERMLVVAGRQEDNVTRLGAVFEVTGDCSSGHVRADPTRLARALIGMDLSGAHLAAWFHSHPGSGPGATHPSSIDINQHADWIRDYSPSLLGLTLVADGWFRFWGAALETGKIEVEITGSGLSKEDTNGHLYRLNA